MYMYTLVGMSVCVDQIYCTCSVMFIGHKTLADLVNLDVKEFYVLLGLSWLSSYYVILDYFAKTVTITMPK